MLTAPRTLAHSSPVTEEPSSLIRELYRFDYAPRPGTAYDRETGLLTSQQTFDSQAVSFLEHLSRGQSLQDCLSNNICSDDSTLETHSDFIDEDLECVKFIEIPDILYHPHAVNSPAAWIRYNAKKLNES